MAASLEIFSDEGFAGTTTRQIAARANVNLGLIKYYFGSKDALWRAAVDDVFAALGKELGPLVSQPAIDAEGAKKIVATAVRFAAHNPALIRLMNDECKRDSDRMRWLVDHHGRPLYEAIGNLLAPLRREGTIPDVADVHLYYMFVGALGMIFSQAPECRRLTGKDPTGDQRLMAAHVDAVLALFFRDDAR